MNVLCKFNFPTSFWESITCQSGKIPVKRGDASITFGEHLYKREKRGMSGVEKRKKLRQKRTEFQSEAAGKPPNLPGILPSAY